MTLGLYVQFPFCASKCSFCNFSSRVAPRAAFKPYVRAVKDEIRLIPTKLPLLGADPDVLLLGVESVYCGGGTPSLAGEELLCELFQSLRNCFRLSAAPEWTLEITPGSAEVGFLESVKRLGVNRLSIGAQSFVDRELSSTGRLHSAEDTKRQIGCARRAAFRNVSIDLIAGLPFQTSESWLKTLEETIRLFPEHVSIYLFEADERSRLGREANTAGSRYHASALPGEDFMAEAYEKARDVLKQHGYVQYEISNFALPGFESQHNQRYWQMEPYLGVGAGAHSFDGRSRWANLDDPAAYHAKLSSGDLPIAECHKLSSTEEAEEFFFLGLRQCQGVSLGDARRKWGTAPLNWWEKRAAELGRAGLLRERAGRLVLSESAYLVSNEVFQQFIA
jgi:oxygen-independent coproporphyrinogen III oxidase